MFVFEVCEFTGDKHPAGYHRWAVLYDIINGRRYLTGLPWLNFLISNIWNVKHYCIQYIPSDIFFSTSIKVLVSVVPPVSYGMSLRIQHMVNICLGRCCKVCNAMRYWRNIQEFCTADKFSYNNLWDEMSMLIYIGQVIYREGGIKQEKEIRHVWISYWHLKISLQYVGKQHSLWTHWTTLSYIPWT